MTEDDPYAALAAVYDSWQEKYGAFWRFVLPKLLATFAAEARPPSSFLDLGCGTGSLLHGLRRQLPSWRLCGMDASPAMLDKARGKRDANSITWVQGSFDQTSDQTSDQTQPGPPFDAAGAFFDALNHVLTPPALTAAFATAARALHPGGLLIFDLNNQRGFEAWWQGLSHFVGPDWTLDVEGSWDPDTRLGHGRATVQFRTDHNPPQVTRVLERCYSTDEVRGCLTAAGLTVLASDPWSPQPHDPPGKTWWVARKDR